MNLNFFLVLVVAASTVPHVVVDGFDENFYMCIPGLKASYGGSIPLTLLFFWEGLDLTIF